MIAASVLGSFFVGMVVGAVLLILTYAVAELWWSDRQRRIYGEER